MICGCGSREGLSPLRAVSISTCWGGAGGARRREGQGELPLPPTLGACRTERTRSRDLSSTDGETDRCAVLRGGFSIPGLRVSALQSKRPGFYGHCLPSPPPVMSSGAQRSRDISANPGNITRTRRTPGRLLHTAPPLVAALVEATRIRWDVPPSPDTGHVERNEVESRPLRDGWRGRSFPPRP